MKVALISTYPPARCGIGEYTRNLHQALRVENTEWTFPVVAEGFSSSPGFTDDPDVHRPWRRTGDWVRDIASSIHALKPDVAHIQHEEAILNQDGRLPRLLDELRRMGVGTLVTLHSVYPGPFAPPFRWRPARYHRALAAAGAHLLVHQNRGCADVLRGQGVDASAISVVPHGTTSLERPERQLAREKLGLRDVPTVLFFGVLHKKKGIHTVVKAFPDVRRHIPNAQLVIAGQPRDRNILDRIYQRWLDGKLNDGKRAGWLEYRRGFVPEAQMAPYLAAADLVAFPHNQSYGSASGVLHLAFAAGRAPVCSRGPKFFEAFEAYGDRLPEAFATPGDPVAWANALTTLLASGEKRQQAEACADERGRATRWQAVAHQHAALYARIAEQRPRG